MKRFIPTLMAFFASVFCLSAQQTDYHVLTARWKEYQKAAGMDRPADQIRILESIISEAREKKLAWDHYDAWNKLVDARSMRNWKDVDAARRDRAADIENNGMAIEKLKDSRAAAGAKAALIRELWSELESSRNPGFYDRTLEPLFSNDLDWAIWSLRNITDMDDNVKLLFDGQFGGRYPFAELLELERISQRKDYAENLTGIAEAYGEFARRNEGRAVALLARDHLTEVRFNLLNADRNAKAEQYRALCDECIAIEREAGRFRGSEKVVAGKAYKAVLLRNQLEEKRVECSIENDVLKAEFRNTKSLKVDLADEKGGRSVFSTLLRNEAGRFYVLDSVSIRIPDLPDGNYRLRYQTGQGKEELVYQKHSLSISIRRNSDGMGVFVADRLTGKPAESYDLTLFINGKAASTAHVLASPDGYAPLPKEMASKITNSYCSIQAESTGPQGRRIISSRNSMHYGFLEHGERRRATESNCVILTDRAAFHPEETVSYKAIFYNGRSEYSVMEAGLEAKAILHDLEGNLIESQTLRTNEFGSVSGQFHLPAAKKNGSYAIRVEGPLGTVSGRYIQVDDFKAPSYRLVVDSNERFYLPSDTITISGRIESLDGSSPEGTQISIVMDAPGGTQETATLTTNAGGRFIFTTKAGKAGLCTARIKAVTTTAEVLEERYRLNIRSSVAFRLIPDNNVRGDARVGNKGNIQIYDGKEMRFSISTDWYSNLSYPGMCITASLMKDGTAIRTISSDKNETMSFSTDGIPSGLYSIDVTCEAVSEEGKTYREKMSMDALLVRDSDAALPFEIKGFFKSSGRDVQIGVPSGKEAWIVAELYENGSRLAESRIIHIEGSSAGLTRLFRTGLGMSQKKHSDLTIRLLYFLDGEVYSYSHYSKHEQEMYEFPLSFSRFTDVASPASRYTVTFASAPESEIATAIFDARTEAIMSNEWHTYRPYRETMAIISESSECGKNRTVRIPVLHDFVEEEAIPFMAAKSESVANRMDGGAMSDELYVSEDLHVREDFAGTLAWEPQIHTDGNGNASMTFSTADNLSTFIVQSFAHDRKFNNATIRKEMVVRLPVRIALSQPAILRTGDTYSASISLSNTGTDKAVGTVTVRFIDGADYRNGKVLQSTTRKVSVDAGGNLSLKVPYKVASEGILGIFASFSSDSGASDAMFVTVPVESSLQTITESHSALLFEGTDREALIRELTSLFRNTNGKNASVSEISISDMLDAALPETVTPRGEDALSQARALYGRHLLGQKADREIIDRILTCRNADMGFAWFQGMQSSPVITASLLELFAGMGDGCPKEIAALLPQAVHFLDNCFLEGTTGTKRLIFNALSMEQYLYVRSMYADVPMEAKVSGEWNKAFRNYLTPSKERGLNGMILAKARRILTLDNMKSKVPGADRSIREDLESIMQYAQPHRSGGTYFPNAVLPWRGLLESEIYAHVTLCNLFDRFGHPELAEGIRLWIMTQKETQQWEDDPAYIQALAAVSKAQQSTLDTRVLILTDSSSIPFSKVRKSGNGFDIDVRWYRDGELLSSGKNLKPGDRIKATYRIHSDENRSFVKLTAPRPASFQPVNQLSGWDYLSRGYRSILKGRTEFWFDTWPEEYTEITEEFFVTQEGIFNSPVIEIESLYAPHYRANAGPSL